MRNWPLTGRHADLAAILGTRRDPASAGVVVAGAAGLGKTRLAREAVDRLARAGARTAWVLATRAAASIPFGAVAHLVPVERGSGDRLVDLIRAGADWARREGGRARVVIGVDDAHLLDEGSAALVAHLAVSGLAFVILTARSGEPTPDAVTALWKDGHAVRIDLDALSEGDVDRLIDHDLALGDDGALLDSGGREFLRRTASGNPLALRELLAAGRASGTLERRRGVWHWSGTLAAPAPVAELIAANLAGLSDHVRAAVELVACGEPVPLATLVRLTDPAAITEATTRGLILLERKGSRRSLRVSHPLYGELVRAVLPPLRAAEIWRDLAAAALDAPLRRRDDSLRVAMWQVDGGLIVRPDIVLRGAEDAVDRSDLALAERLARAARQAAPGPEADRILGEILEYRGSSAEAAVIPPDSPPPRDQGIGAWAVARASTLYWGGGRVDAAEAVLDLAAGAADEDHAEATRSWILLFDGRCAESTAIARRLLARPDTHPQAAIWAAACGSSSAAYVGDHAAAIALHARGTALADAHRTEFPWGVVQIGFSACFMALAGGDLEAGRRVAAEGHQAAVAGHTPLMAGGFAAFRGLIEIAQGRPLTADSTLREAIGVLERNDTFRFVRGCLIGLAQAAALTGRLEAAESWISRADVVSGGWNRLFAPARRIARAWIASANGDGPSAREQAESAADMATSLGLPTQAALASYDVVRLGGSVAPERFSAGDAPIVPVLRNADAALGADDPSALVTAAEGFVRLGHPLLAAETMTAAARALRKAGRRGSGSVVAERAALLRRSCEGARTPLLGDSTGLLTRREREVAALAVRMPSREIADRLGLSVNTVHNNLARVYTKLGLSGRPELRRRWEAAE